MIKIPINQYLYLCLILCCIISMAASAHPLAHSMSDSMSESKLVMIQVLSVLINVALLALIYGLWLKTIQLLRLKKSNKTLCKEDINKYLQRLIFAIEVDQLYLDANLKVDKLVGLIKVNSANELALILRQTPQKNFYDFINYYRIEHAKTLLLKEEAGRTVLDIALDSGFNSKSAFYRAFKKHTGLSPQVFQMSQYVVDKSIDFG